MTARVVSSWVAWFSVASLIVFASASAYLFLDAARFSVPTLLNPRLLFVEGPRAAGLLRFASLCALVAFLAVIPIAIYLRNRHREDDAIGAFTVAGYLLAYLGVAVAAVMAGIGAPMVVGESRDYKGVIAHDFATLYAVVAGALEWVEPVLAALWLVPTGLVARRRGDALLGYALIVTGLLGLLVPISRLSGSHADVVGGPLG